MTAKDRAHYLFWVEPRSLAEFEGQFEAAVDEALERAAVLCEGNHGSFGRAFAREIRKLKSQPGGGS